MFNSFSNIRHLFNAIYNVSSSSSKEALSLLGLFQDKRFSPGSDCIDYFLQASVTTNNLHTEYSFFIKLV